MDYFKNHIDNNTFDEIPIENIKNLLDIGTGTGFIALFFQIIKEIIPKFNPNIYASDIFDGAIKLSKKNEKLNNFENEISFIHSDLFDSFPDDLKNSFNIIIFNPPYLPSFKTTQVTKKREAIDYSWDGGKEGIEVFVRFLDEVRFFLNLQTNCRIYYVCSSRVNLDKLYRIIDHKGFKNTILERRHVFMEDIYLNKLEVKPN